MQPLSGTRVDTDRNLLFGIVALQLEFVDSSQFTEACAAWAVARERTLAQILVERGWISAADSAEVEQLVARKIAKHAGDSHKSLLLESTGELPPKDSYNPSQLKQTIDSAATPASGEALLETQDSTPNSAPVSTPTGYDQMETMQYDNITSAERSRYSLTKMHGEGGIGRVWQAHDQRLNRQVALKEIRPDKETSSKASKRFAKEAQITSQLEHPNIVPVYELSGDAESARSFYTMRFVRGDTFRDAIDAYHRHRRAGTATELELRELLNSFIAICNALGYAHSRGVLHRDLKPSNVMVGSFGEVIVLDWGLAKMIDQDDDDDENLLESGPISVTDDVEMEATVQGAVLGTLPYMAPEQAAGRIDKIDTRTDIYGLGAILFAILTGDHPHRGTSTREVRSQIVNEPTPRVRSENSSVHRGLDAICAKAMAKKRSERYSKARDLAEDIRRWLADEPIECYPESMLANAGRWLRRHRTWAKAIAATLLIVTAVSIAAVMLIENARRDEQLAKEAANQSLVAERKAKAEATLRFGQARDAVDVMMTEVSDVLKYFPGMQSLREKLLTQAMERYEQFAAEKTDDPELQVEAAHAMIRLGDVFRGLSKYDLAEKTYQEAIDRLANLETSGTNAAQVQIQRAEGQAKLGVLNSELGNNEQSLSAYNTAVEIYDQLLDASPEPAIELERAGTVVNRAMLRSKQGNREQALTELEAAAKTFTRLAEDSQNPAFVAGLAMTQANIANVLVSQGRNADATAHAKDAATLYQTLADKHPNHPPYLESLAATRLNLATAYRTSGLDREEMAMYLAALADYDLLISARPDVPLYRERQASTQRELAMFLHSLGNNREAHNLITEAISTTESLLNTQIPLAGYHEQWALEQATLGRILGDLDLNEEAALRLNDAIERYDALIEGDPDYSVGYQAQRAGCLSALGTLFYKTSEFDAAQATLTQAADAIQELLANDSESATYKNMLAWVHKYLADLAWDTERAGDARTHYQQAVNLRAGLVSEPDHLNSLARLIVSCRDADLADEERAIEAAKQATQLAPNNARFFTTLGSAYAKSARFDDAIRTLETVDTLAPQGGSTHELWLVFALTKRNDETDMAAAANRFEQSVTRMDLNAPGRHELQQLRAKVAPLLTVPET